MLIQQLLNKRLGKCDEELQEVTNRLALAASTFEPSFHTLCRQSRLWVFLTLASVCWSGRPSLLDALALGRPRSWTPSLLDALALGRMDSITPLLPNPNLFLFLKGV